MHVCDITSWYVHGCNRAAVLSDAVVNYFLVDLDIERHFVALRRYLLLQDGEYTLSLTDQLFNKVFTPSLARSLPVIVHCRL